MSKHAEQASQPLKKAPPTYQEEAQQFVEQELIESDSEPADFAEEKPAIEEPDPVPEKEKLMDEQNAAENESLDEQGAAPEYQKDQH